MVKQVVVLNENVHSYLKGSNVRGGPMSASAIDVKGLEHDLRAAVGGEVRFDDGSRALYSTDASNYRQVPIGAVVPRMKDDVVTTVAICRYYGAPIVARGGGTSLAGQTCNVAVVIDMSKYMNTIVALDQDKKQARVLPGIILDDLRAAAERYNLTFGPDPATHNHCTLGGMIGNNSCGVHALMAGKTADNIEELEILTYDGLRMRVGQIDEVELARIINAGGRKGEIYAALKRLRDTYADLIRERFPKIPRRVSGYNLDQLLPENGFHVARALVGTEGTCVTVLEATTRLVYSPPKRSLLVLGYPDIYRACDHIPNLLEHQPIGLEGFDDVLIGDTKKKGLHPEKVALLPRGGGWLMMEFGGEKQQEAHEKAQALMEALKKQGDAPDMKLLDDPHEQRAIWAVREAALGATAIVPSENPTWPGWEDSAVAPEAFSGYLRDLRKLLDSYNYRASFYGHFGQGCLHTRVDFDLKTRAGIEKFRAFINQAADLVVRYGGSFSGEHGDGQSRAELLPKMYGNELVEAFREFKAIWDPNWKMNPGKMVNAYRFDENLRLGSDYRPLPVRTHFQFPDDNGSFAQATLRCVGVGKCRRMRSGTMCPSFMVTREEADTTRGRARLLFEMLQGDPLQDGWRDEHVREALDLCLACKGCKGDCPVSVDMATYKAEFLAHYYQGRLRPITAYTMGQIQRWARLAALMPGVANFVTQTPILSNLMKFMGGIAPQRRIPAFAPQTFKSWFRQRGPRNEGSPQVILWPDTFNNYFHPQTAMAAVEVLEDAGYQVVVPEQTLCCGRPLYDYGFLDQAERLLRRVLDALRPQIEAGIPLVGLEPSCVAVFRDELRNLMPHDEDARRLSQQSYLLSEFLEQHATHYQPRKLKRRAVVHGHCHHKAIMRMKDEEALLTKLGLDFQTLDSGCCGMAGAFGFEKEHYDVSIKAGERVLLPAVRDASPDTLIIADGFSCREQIAQCTDRRALHVAQVLQLALHQDQQELSSEYPEARYVQSYEQQTKRPQKQLWYISLIGKDITMLLKLPVKEAFGRSPARSDGKAQNGSGPWWAASLQRLLPSAFRRDERVVVQHIREGRFQRSLSLITAFASLLSGLEATYEHYIGSYSQRIMYTPVFISLALTIAGVWGAFNRWVARVVLPVVSLITVIDGVVGFIMHVRGVHRKPGGWRIPVFNIIMGPPLLAPLLFATSGFLGLIATFLRREEDLGLPRGRLPQRSLWLDVLPQEITKDISAAEQDIREGRFQRIMAIATAISAFFSGFESLYSHYKNNFTYRIEWTPILLTPAIIAAGLGSMWSRTIARTLLPLTSALAMINGAIGFFYHVRGVVRRPGGLKLPFYNMLYGPPVFAPLLFAATGFLGLLASLLRREK